MQGEGEGARRGKKLLDLLLPASPSTQRPKFGFSNEEPAVEPAPSSDTREKLREMLRSGKLEDRPVEVEVRERSGGSLQVFSNTGIEEMGLNIQVMLGGGGRTKKRRMPVGEAAGDPHGRGGRSGWSTWSGGAS